MRCRNEDGTLVLRHPEILSELVPKGSNIAYDIEVFIGIERYLHHKQREEIKSRLVKEHGISISTGEISNLAKRFSRHFEALHILRSPELKKTLIADGGYPMNVDATGEAGRGTLFVTHAGWRKWVLGTWRLTTECSDQILPCLQQTGKQFGAPLTVMRDLGKAMLPSVEKFVDGLDEDVKILSCHEHFLADIGSDLLEPSYNDLRKLFRKYGVETALRALSREWGKRLGVEAKEVRKDIEEWFNNEKNETFPSGTQGLAIVRSLVQWDIDYPADNKKLRFPFDRPYLDFYHRCVKVRRALDNYLRRPPEDAYVLRSMRRLVKIIDPIVKDRNFNLITKILKRRAALFDDLRKTLRLIPRIARSKEKPLPPQSEKQRASELTDIEKSLKKYTLALKKQRPKRGPGQNSREAIDIILDHLERHGDTLFGHIVKLPSHAGGGIRIIDRTNIIAEGFFNDLKHKERRRSGRKILGQDMENLPPNAALVSNLNHTDYIDIVCDGRIDNLPAIFAEYNTKNLLTLEDFPSDEFIVETASLSRSDKTFVRKEFLGRSIDASASSRAPRVEADKI